MNSTSRKVVGGMGILAGAALVAFEIARFSTSGPFEQWFWLMVGVLVAAFGLAQVLSDGRPPPP